MEQFEGNYKLYTEISDFGPFVSKLILSMPSILRKNDIHAASFLVYVEKKSIHTGEITCSVDFKNPQVGQRPGKGYQSVTAAYPSDEDGNRRDAASFVTLELMEEPLGRRIEGNAFQNEYVFHDYRITLLHEIPSSRKDEFPLSGLVFAQCAGDVCPQREGWQNNRSKSLKMPLNYSYFMPDFEKLDQPKTDFMGRSLPPVDTKLPLVIWLHGAGEGGSDPIVAYTGNKAVNLSSPDIQGKLGGAAWILVPQCPTVWMDDGEEQLGRSNQSIYTRPLKACIDEFIREHGERIDTDRIYIGGCSNGGFMTVRMLIDYPDFFAAAFPACEAFYDENITDKIVKELSQIPLWLIHAQTDELVNPFETAVPLYKRLKAAGADNLHFSFFDHMEDLTGMYRDEKGRPQRYFNHAVWIHVYNDDICYDYDGTYAMHDGVPVTLWKWLGKQKRTIV